MTVDVINLPSGTLLGALTAEVSYDPAKLSVTSCAKTVDSPFDSVICNANQPGVVRLSALSTAGLSGNIAIALINLQSVGAASTVATLGVSVTTFVDLNANPLPLSKQDGAIVFACPLGDVDCSAAITTNDALFITQYAKSIRPPSDTIPLPKGFLYLLACDLTGDQLCDGEDARLILQCEIGVANKVCPGGN